MSKSIFQQLAEYFDALGKRYTGKRTGQFVIYTEYILGEKMCTGLSEICVELDKLPLTQTQSRVLANKMRVIGKLITKDLDPLSLGEKNEMQELWP